ncbi:hypothetical protein DA2_1422 [Desulfovibrio sp. A2]|nr:hypothetical protein DA2_1422 [Desulfovibrio sp. A2]
MSAGQTKRAPPGGDGARCVREKEGKRRRLVGNQLGRMSALFGALRQRAS